MTMLSEKQLQTMVAALHALQKHGYPYAVDEEMNDSEIDSLCETLNCNNFSSVPMHIEDAEITIYSITSDTDTSTGTSVFPTEAEAHECYIDMVLNYSGVVDILKQNNIVGRPTFQEAFNAWDGYVDVCASNLDTISYEEHKIKMPIAKKPLPNVCPNCGADASTHVTYEEIHIDNNKAYQDCFCCCGARWNEAYDFREIVALDVSDCKNGENDA